MPLEEQFYAEGDCTAISILLPEVDQVYGSLRQRYDSTWQQGSVAHISLLYPFIEPTRLSESDISTLQKLANRWHSFDLDIQGLCGFPEALYLAIEPHNTLMKMHRDLGQAFPDIFHYRIPWEGEPVFHISIACSASVPVLDQAVQDYLDMEIDQPQRFTVGDVALCQKISGRWQTAECFPLDGK
ncbi:2'-5' RNA ligase family protein [Parendozoicomonas haliclonae]|uniref:2',5' RNA ligase family n=1 Tax=Parendozoicomonas haliclonae TaxID=1960125 RepID=A0A1X7AMM1_9GAMM|nr:2'-5' RNA ligase family protein [Parendozoicomonas haliclonae]SMA49210.1 hypothetical protein EHSB41UT_03114 [Parendozoicomonas haliclonae]